MVRATCPGRVDVGIGVEDGLQILPFTGVSALVSMVVDDRGQKADLYSGHPSASSRSLDLSRTRLSGPLLRTAPSGREPTGRECRSTMFDGERWFFLCRQ